jgi:hypothetical protein
MTTPPEPADFSPPRLPRFLAPLLFALGALFLVVGGLVAAGVAWLMLDAQANAAGGDCVGAELAAFAVIAMSGFGALLGAGMLAAGAIVHWCRPR